MYQALYRKWRPRTFDDVVGQRAVTETLKRQVASGRLSHAYLFTGTRGTGKTTCAKILSRAVNCLHPVDGNPCNQCEACLGIENGSILDVLELDAASNNGVDQVRALRDEAVYTPAAVKKRVYIVDEVHMLSTAAFNALLKILEEPPEHLMFILATTELHKVPATIKSRCQQFAFQRLHPGEIAGRLQYVAKEEGLDLTEDGAALLSRLADGGMRDGLSLLDQCAVGAGTIDEAKVLSALGLAGNLETAGLMGEIAARDADAALGRLGKLYAGGKDVSAALGELAALTRDLLIRKTAPRSGGALLTGGYDEATLRSLGEVFTAQRLSWMLELLQKTLVELPRSANRRTDGELCLIRLCDERADSSLEGILARLDALERGGIQAPVTAAAVPEKAAGEAPGKVPAEAPGEEDAPPWAVEEPVKAPAVEREPAAAPPVAQTVAAPPVMESPGGAVEADLWSALLPMVKARVSRKARAFLPEAVGEYTPGQLSLWVADETLQRAIGGQDTLGVIEELAAERMGRPVRCLIKVGKPAGGGAAPPPEAGHDNLEDLLAMGSQLDNFTVEE